jgi:hypothetical protein
MISVLIDKEVKELLDVYAADLDLSVSRFARNLMYVGLDEFKLLRKVGLIQTMTKFSAMLESVKKLRNKKKK